MKAKLLTYLLFMVILNVGCERHLVRQITSDKMVFGGVNSHIGKSGSEHFSEDCFFKPVKITKTGNFHDFNFYEFDTIRIYVRQIDTLLNTLIQKGFIQGQYFFSPEEANNCYPTQWNNPIKSDHNNWVGYNFYVGGLAEIKTLDIPKKSRNKIDLYKVFMISFWYEGQPYINPEVFMFELTNKEYKYNHNEIPFDTFIDKANTTKFYHKGFEI